MQRRHAYATLLFLTTQLVSPAVLAQVAGGAAAPAPAAPPQTSNPADSAGSTDPQSDQSAPEISAPGIDPLAGEEIVVTGRHIPNVVRATPQIVSVLSSADIARTGEGDIAGALTRVTGLSVAGGG